MAQALHLAPSRCVLPDLSRVLHESRTLPMESWAGPAEDAGWQEFGACFAFACKAMNSTKPQGLGTATHPISSLHVHIQFSHHCSLSSFRFKFLGSSFRKRHRSSHTHTIYRWINQLSFRSCLLFTTAAEKMLPEYSKYGHACIPH